MKSQRQKREARREQRKIEAQTQNGTVIEIARPKIGPGQVFTREFIDAKSGYNKRYRNIAVTPLMLAYHRGQLESPNDHRIDQRYRITAQERFDAGEKFGRWWYIHMQSNSKDSTDVGIGGGDGLFWTEAKAHASEQIGFVRTRMHHRDYKIVERFCGYGLSMCNAMRGVVDVHPDGVAFRIREALDDLVAVTTGRRIIFDADA